MTLKNPLYITLTLLAVTWNSTGAFLVPSFFSSKKHGVFGKPTKLGMSVLSPLDTVTSGFASIARLPFGTSVASNSATSEQSVGFSIKALYDTEHSNDCRSVRERISELDLNVDVLVPAAPNSRTFSDEAYDYYLKSASSDDIPRMVVDEEGSETVLVGSDTILNYLDTKFGKRESVVDPEDSEAKAIAFNTLVNAGAFLPALLRYGRGELVDSCATSKSTPRPSEPLILYSYEGNQFCRLVREVLTELDIPYQLRSAGKGSPRREELAGITGGSTQCPYLMDPNTGTNLPESKDIIEYLYKNYATFTPPNKALGFASKKIISILKPLFAILAPLQAGSYKEDKVEYQGNLNVALSEIGSDINSEKVVVYTYQLSPFCTECLEVLDNLDIKYKEISLGLEWVPFLIAEGGAMKRVALGGLTGQTSLPHVFVNGESVGGLYDGLVPALEDGTFWDKYKKDATETDNNTKVIEKVEETGQFE